jgi:hypothetical protein
VEDEGAPDAERAAEQPASNTTLSRGDASPDWEASSWSSRSPRRLQDVVAAE